MIVKNSVFDQVKCGRISLFGEFRYRPNNPVLLGLRAIGDPPLPPWVWSSTSAPSCVVAFLFAFARWFTTTATHVFGKVIPIFNHSQDQRLSAQFRSPGLLDVIMPVFFTVPKNKLIHHFNDHGESWSVEKNGIDRCSICGMAVRTDGLNIVKDTFAFRTRYRTYTMCRPSD